mgnify:CR=1 FL=1
MFSLIFLLTISPWQLYNLSKNGKYQLSTMQNHQLKIYNNQIIRYKSNKYFVDVHDNDYKKKQLNVNIEQDGDIKYLLSNFGIFSLLTLKGVANIFCGTAKTEMLKIYGFNIVNPGKETIFERIKRVYSNLSKEFYLTPILLIKQFIEYILAIIGLCYFFVKRKNKEVFTTIIITIIYFTFLPSMYGDPRYKIPIVSIYLICTSAGVMSIYNYYINSIKLKIK